MAQEDLILLEETPKEKEELEIIPDFDAAYSDRSIRPQPSTTEHKEPDLAPHFDLAPHLELIPIPGAERKETDDQLFRRIEEDVVYWPTDEELDKYLEHKSRQPKYALDLIKGAWHGGKAVVSDLAKGVWGAVKDPLLFSPAPVGISKRATTLAEGAARATWDLGTVGRYINDWFGEQGDREYQEEVEDMKLRHSNPDWKMRGAMGGEAYLTKEQKERMRTTWATSYIKERIKEDLEDLETATDNFTLPVKDLQRRFKEKGLTYVVPDQVPGGAGTRDFYTSAEYIDGVLSAKQREKYYKEFPKWINKRQRDRWRRGRYLMRTTELARRGEKTILGELFGPEVDKVAKAYVNSDVATLASYAGGPAEGAAVFSTKLARKSASPSAWAGKATEVAGKGTQWAGEKVQQLGEWATTSPEKSAAVGAALGAAAGDDGITVASGIIGGLAEQRVRVTPKLGELLQKGGTALEAVGEVVAKPEGVEGILKSASRVAKDEDVALTLNRLSLLDPAINFAVDLGKGTAVGGVTGFGLTLPSGDPGVIGSGLGAGATGGFFAAIPGRYLTRGAKLKEQLRNEWGAFQKLLTPEQLNNIKQYAPTLEEMGNVMATVRMLNGVTRGGGNMDFKFLSPENFIKAHGVQRGVVVTRNKTRPSVEINIGYKGPHALYHEAWHALKRFAGETELQRTPEGKQEVEVLKPYLDQIQTILFGKRLGGKTVSEGMFSEKDLVGGFYDQYTSKMAPEERKAFERQFQYDESGKELTPAEANQRKLNYMMEEVEAESFRYLMSHTNPRKITQGDRSLHQRFIDHMLLSEHSKTLRGMRKALEVVGVNFKPTGEPSDIFFQKGKGITNSRELNAALRQYLRAWEGMQYRTRVMGELEPSGFSIGGTGKAGRAQVEYHLSKKENDFLRDHFSSSDMLKKDKDGGVYFDPDGRVVLLTEGEIKKLQENRAELIRDALAETDDGTGMVLKENGAFEGIPSPHQLDAIDRISGEIITPNQKQIIRETADIMRNDPGAPIQFLYNAALGKGKTYSSSLSSTHRTAVPIGFHISKAQNFYFTALDLGAYHRKISAWGDPTKKALHKGGHKLALWDKDVRAFEADLFKYLENHKYDRPGDTGLDPSPQRAEQKRNVLNDFFNINKGEEGVTEGNFNPVAAARRAIDPKTGKQKKRAYRGLENLLRSYRLDRVLDENFGKSMSYALGRAVPMKSGADFYQKQLKNLMPPPAPDTPQFKRFFEGSKVVDADGKPLVVYSGHGNAQLWGTKWDKQKGTAGGFYATEDPAVASSYATGKLGGREFYEEGSEYRFPYKNKRFGKKIWQIDLTPEQQKKAVEFLEDRGYDINKYWRENSRYDAEAKRALLTGGTRRLSNIHKFMDYMGDTIKYRDDSEKPRSEMTLPERLESEGKSHFEDLMDFVGIKWNAFDKQQPGVFPMYLSIKNPLDANKPFPKEVLTDLKKAAARERPKFEGEYWTRDLSLKEFVEAIESGSEFWSTQVPTKAKKIFQRHGYDGIKELGRKGLAGEGGRQVNWIAFEPEQIKSALNRGEFSPESPDIRFMPAPGEGSRITVKGENSPVKVTDNSNSESITVRMYADDVDADFDLRAVEGEGGIYTLINGVPRQQLVGLSMSVIDKLFKKSGLAGRFVEFKESTPKKTKGSKYVDSTTYGVFKGRPKEVLSELEKIVKPLVDSELVDSFEYSPTFKKGETVRLESGGQKKKTVQFEAGLLNDLGVVRSMLPTLGKYPNLQRQLNLALGEMFSVETMKPAPKIPIAKGNPIEAAKRLKNTAEQSSYGRLVQAVVEMNDVELSKLNSLKSADDTSHFYEYGARFMPAPTFYSKAERAVEGAKGGVFDKSGMTTIDKAISLFVKEKKGDKQWQVPEAEVEWSGVVDWLEGRKEEGEASAKAAKAVVDKYERQAAGEDVGIDYVTRDDYLKAEKALIEAEAQAAGKVSKAELLEFLQNKGVKVEEVYRSGRKAEDYDVSVGFVDERGGAGDPVGAGDQINRYTARARDTEGNRLNYKVVSDENNVVTVERDSIETSEGQSLPSFFTESESLYQAKLAIEEDMISQYGDSKKKTSVPEGAEGPTLFKPGESNWVMLPGDEKARQSYGELVLTLPKDRAKSHETFELPSGHRFPESNILAHIRFTERVDADGKKMLFLEELQSDWSGEGRDRGWAKERPPKVQEEILRLREERERKALSKAEEIGLFSEFYEKPDEVSVEAKKDAIRSFWDDQSPFGAAYYPSGTKAAEMKQQLVESVSDIRSRIAELEEKYPHRRGVPDMPFKGDNRYGALALKRMIRWAADNGFDRLGWITGKDTAERYNLQKQVSNITLIDYGTEGQKKLLVHDKNADLVLSRIISNHRPEADLEKHLGKNLAKRLLEQPPASDQSVTPGARFLEGDDLAIGGEWAETLYDKVLPTQAKKIVKKKGAVGRTRLRQDYTPEDLKDNIKHRDLEEELKESEKELNRLELSRPERQNNPNWRTEGNRLHATESLEAAISEMREEILSLKRRIDRTVKSPEANYVDITPEVKALAEEGFSYFMPAGVGRGRATVPAQPTVPTLPATPIMPRVKLTEEEKEDSRRLLNLLKKEGI